MFAAVSLMIARYPTEMIGAHQIALNIGSISFMIPLGISQAITARVGFFTGKKSLVAAQLAGYTGILTSTLLSAVSATVMILLPALFVSFYTQDPRISQLAIGLLFYAAVFQFSDSLQVATAGALRGLKDTKVPLVITVISYWLIGFPAGYYLAEHQGYQINGYWIGLIIGLSTAGVLLLVRWIKISRPSNIIIPETFEHTQ